MSDARKEHDDGNTGEDRRSLPTGRYVIRLKGHLDARWAAWLDGLRLTHETDGTTTLHGPVVDQAALHGLLQKVRDIGVPLISVTQVEPDQPEGPPPSLDDRDPRRRPT